MSHIEKPSEGLDPPPPPQLSSQGHPLPRRTSPGNSVTLKHHRIARDATQRAATKKGQQTAGQQSSKTTSSSRRNSSGDSFATGQSDPNKWFDQSNKNPTATFDSHAMDVDPPFFQRETDSSNEERIPHPQHMVAPARLAAAQSSSADEYRSVIDDLTVEIQKLKDELKRYKQKGPDMLRKDKLFEIKYHGLPQKKKRELESKLRDFTASLGSSADAASSSRKVQKAKNYRDRMYSASGSVSKHASSTSGSNTRPVDSAYASMSTGANSSGQSAGRHQSMNSRVKSSEQKVESYLRDIPEGLYPRHVTMTDKEKKKLVVRRLEQLFTGKISGRSRKGAKSAQPDVNPMLQSVVSEGQQHQSRPVVHQPPQLANASLPAVGNANEASREARILVTDERNGTQKTSRSRDNGSTSQSGGDQTELNGSGSGTNTSPSDPPPPEQRPTRLHDLDPDRVQIPSENMDYIKHLGLLPPELIKRSSDESDIHPDADGWVYLNLLTSLAQLHMINVTPDFVRAAITGVSTRFQLSPDGRKIRWKGGSDGTKFSSDSSEEGNGKSLENEETDSNRDVSRKRQKTGQSTGDEFQSGSSNSRSKAGAQVASSDSFHYKPLFVHRQSSGGQTSPDETLSSFGPIEDSNMDESGWGQSGSGGTGNNRRKRRHDGAIIYYSGAPFCTDLSGDAGSASPMAYMMSNGQAQDNDDKARPEVTRTASGSSLPYRPLTEKGPCADPISKMDIDDGVPALTADSGNESGDELDVDINLSWTNDQQFLEVHPLEPCGLGGVMPEDHFMVVVTTKRPKEELAKTKTGMSRTEETTDSIIGRLASMSTSSPAAITATSSRKEARTMEIEYTSGRIKRLAPVRLPPPAIFFPPFSSDGSSDTDDMSTSYGDDELESSEVTSRRADIHQSDGYPDGVDLTSGDEDGEDPENEPDTEGMYVGPAKVSPVDLMERRRQSSLEATGRTDPSSAATVGGPGSVGSDDDMSS